MEVLRTKGVTSTAFALTVVRNVKSNFQHLFMKNLMEKLDAVALKGGVLLQVGNGGSAKVRRFIPVLAFFTMDNMGASQFAGIYTGNKSSFLCRLCMKPSASLHQPGMNYPYRHEKEHNVLRKKAEKSLIKKVQNYRERLSQPDRGNLEACRKISIHPGDIFFFDYCEKHPIYKVFNPFCKFPPDEMHTVLGGIMKDWIFWVALIIEQIARKDSSFTGNLMKIDVKLQNFPVGVFPDFLRRFTFTKVNYQKTN